MTLQINKPAYKVPTMAEIKKIKPNGYKVVSTFSGAGGTCLGYKMAGYDVVWASEFVPKAREVYEMNHDTYVDGNDIRTVSGEDILRRINMKIGELDILEGSPPCASFSTSGKRHKHWGQVKSYSDKKQRTDDLFDEYIRLINQIKPKVFVAENVMGLVKGKAKGYFKDIMKGMKASGYQVQAKGLDASWLGVPQARQRVFFMGVRNDLNIQPTYPRPLPYQMVLKDILPNIKNNEGIKDAIRYFAPAYVREYHKIKQGKKSDKYITFRRSHFDKPCLTVMATHSSGPAHPIEPRHFTINELKQICSFPEDFKLIGRWSQQFERLGRSVPPFMAKAIAETIQKEVLDKCPR
tara:strand:+ start:6325 stop:7377 length:1053 start_codon:yes stop_codon:yes gene_type:complete